MSFFFLNILWCNVRLKCALVGLGSECSIYWATLPRNPLLLAMLQVAWSRVSPLLCNSLNHIHYSPRTLRIFVGGDKTKKHHDYRCVRYIESYG